MLMHNIVAELSLRRATAPCAHQCTFMERDAAALLAPAGSAMHVATALSLGLKEEQHASQEVAHRMQTWCAPHGHVVASVRHTASQAFGMFVTDYASAFAVWRR